MNKLTWKKYFPQHKRQFIGLYALYSGKTLIYIGHSSNVPKRLRTHEHSYQNAKYKEIHSLVEARYLEEKLIRRLKPPMNKDFTKVETETKNFSCALELDVWKAIKIKHAVKDVPVADIVNEALREQLERWIEIGNEAS